MPGHPLAGRRCRVHCAGDHWCVDHEGKAQSAEEAEALATSGEIDFAPCHHYGAVGPMAGVTSASMQVYIVKNETHGNLAFSNLNEGYGRVLRYGAYQEDVQERLRWMNSVMAPVLHDALAASGPMDIRALLAEALHMGDEGHNRNKAGSILYTKNLAPYIAKVAPSSDVAADILKFLGDNALSVLNPVMAACKAMCDAAHGVEGSTIVSTMARNGTNFGIRVSGLGDQWFSAPANSPTASTSPATRWMTPTQTLATARSPRPPASAALPWPPRPPSSPLSAASPAMPLTPRWRCTRSPLPSTKASTSRARLRARQPELTCARWWRRITPRINTGIAHKNAGVGQVGAGLVRPPMAIFEALVAFAERYGF
ncbi:MAG: DUF1116 domain-containing protein [Caldilineaceae bacterium]